MMVFNLTFSFGVRSRSAIQIRHLVSVGEVSGQVLLEKNMQAVTILSHPHQRENGSLNLSLAHYFHVVFLI